MKEQLGSTSLLVVAVLISTSFVACDSTEVIKETSVGNLSGVVRDAGTETPMSDIPVTLNSVETTTDQNGRFDFREVPVGLMRLEAGTTGYDTYSAQIDVQAGDNSRDISLTRRSHYQFLSESGNYDLYLRPGVSTFRGVIFLGQPSGQDTRGFASGVNRESPPAGLNEFVAAERQRSLMLAEKHGLALMGSQGGALSEKTTSTILEALEQFAEESAHGELAQAPLLMIGFSAGGCLAYKFTEHHPERTIGFMTQKGNCRPSFGTSTSQSTRLVPGYLFIGEEDSEARFEAIAQLFEEHRPKGALWALAVEPGAGHTPISNQTLLFNWMDTVLEARLPETVTYGAPVTLNALNETSGWLGNVGSLAIADYAGYDDDPMQASWLPSMQTAQDWQEFVTPTIH